MNPTIAKTLKITALAAGLALLGIYWSEIAGTFSLLGDRERVIGLLSGTGETGPLVLAVLIFAQVFLAWIPGHVLIISGGFLYGFPQAFAITAAMTILASQLAFLLARGAGRPVVERFVPAHLLSRWESAAERQGLKFFLFAFWLPAFPSDLMCFIAGLGKIKSGHFFIANFFGRLPVAALLVYIGAFGQNIPVQVWGIAAAALIALLIGRRLASKARTNLSLSLVRA